MAFHPLTPTSAFREMTMIRQFEEAALELSREGEIAGSIHLCIGQEAIPVGALSALTPGDRVLSTYRGHGWALACGADPIQLLAEIAQRAGGLNGGRAGSPLLSDPRHGFLGENSIVGAGSPISTGVAIATQILGTGRVVVTSFGDGAMNQGSTTEGMAFAAARDLPVIFLCENNGWSEMTPTSVTTRGDDMITRGIGLGIRSVVVDGGDPFAVAEAVQEAAEQCRTGQGPVFLECKTVRLSGHYNKDIEHYRPEPDQAAARAADPLVRLATVLGPDSGRALEQIDHEVSLAMTEVITSVRKMPLPDPTTVFDHLYADAPAHFLPQTQPQPAKEMPYFRAINEALKLALEQRPEVVVYGEDVGHAGGIFGVTRGLQKRFGEERVFDTPIAEAAILGSAVGAALEGLRPVVEIMWADFVFVALDQIINQAANVRYVNRSALSAPLTIRMQQGITPGSCAQHSQNIEAILAHVPGIKVGLPSNPQDAYRMTLAAINDPDPTIVIEHRSLYQDSGLVARGGQIESAEGAVVVRAGTDLAIITWGSCVQPAVEAAAMLATEGVEATVLDLRWLRPLDDEAIAAAVKNADGRVMVVHEATRSGGFGAEIAARVTEHHFSDLPGPVLRVGMPDVRVPSAPALQDALVISAERIADAARSQVKR